ncbi:MAG: ATP-dependent DNA ligase [Actinomycetota bacterium]|nr:ATP-dependent DNA ligase [Actinomycetota bacterium]
MELPVKPMLARLARELPRGDYLYEPKWDGFRALAFRAGRDVELQSRHGRPLGRYFPELTDALAEVAGDPFVVDGEIVVTGPEGFDFAALMARLHPTPSRVERLRRETPATFVAFDLLELDGRELLETPFAERRRRLELLFDAAETPLRLTPITDEPGVAAAWLERFEGVVAKPRDLLYEPGRRSMVKVKHDRTADCVVGGFRWMAQHPFVGSLLLGLYDEARELVHVGVVTSFSEPRRRALVAELTKLAAPLEGHPWEHGFNLGPSPMGRLLGAAGRWIPGEMTQDWVPLRPDAVVEVAYDQVDGHRFRHPARFRRWRPDREPRSCTLDQLDAGASTRAGAVG